MRNNSFVCFFISSTYVQEFRPNSVHSPSLTTVVYIMHVHWTLAVLVWRVATKMYQRSGRTASNQTVTFFMVRGEMPPTVLHPKMKYRFSKRTLIKKKFLFHPVAIGWVKQRCFQHRFEKFRKQFRISNVLKQWVQLNRSRGHGSFLTRNDVVLGSRHS